MMFDGEKYINPFTDFGFKKLFGEEPNKDLLLDFLNELLKGERGTIKNLTYKKSERLDDSPDGRKVYFDLFCETEEGEKFIVEMQNTWQQFYKDRVLFYATYPIRDQYPESGMGGGWDYNLKPIYVVSIVNFALDREKVKNEIPPGLSLRKDVMLVDKVTYEVFYDKLTLIFLQMPLFNKTIDQLETRFDKWLYVLKNLHRLDLIPETLKEKTFEKFFAAAEIARLSKEDRIRYEEGLKNILDMNNVIDSSRYLGREEGLQAGMQAGKAIGKEEGLAEGERIGKIKTAKKLLAMGMKKEDIASATGLSIEEIDAC